MTPGRLLWFLRRDLKRGLPAAWHDYVTASRMISHPPPDRPAAPWPVEIHALFGAQSWRLLLWMLSSWEHHSGYRWPLRLWEDGSLDESTLAALRRARPRDQIERKPEVNETMSARLSRHPQCRAYRERHPLAQKIFDFPLLASEPRIMLFDSDVLFFAKADEIVGWCASGEASCWFNADVAEGSLITPAEASRLGVELWPRVNSGLCLLDRDFLDLDLCERALRETSLLRGHPWRVEQTLFALCASRGKGGLLPPTYQVTLDRTRRADAISRHYVGAVRDHFYGEGVRELAPVLLR